MMWDFADLSVKEIQLPLPSTLPSSLLLVYTAWVIDSNNNMHRVIVDAGNGKVLSNQQIPMREAMMMMHMMMHGGAMMMMSPQSGMGMMGPMMGGFHP
jgi:hypothetical protein